MVWDLFEELRVRQEAIVRDIEESLKGKIASEEPSDDLADRILKEFKERKGYFDSDVQLLALSCLADDYARSLAISHEYFELANKEGIGAEKRGGFLGNALRMLARAGKAMNTAKTIYPELHDDPELDSMFGGGIIYETSTEYLTNFSQEVRLMCEFPSNSKEITDKMTMINDARKLGRQDKADSLKNELSKLTAWAAPVEYGKGNVPDGIKLDNYLNSK